MSTKFFHPEHITRNYWGLCDLMHQSEALKQLGKAGSDEKTAIAPQSDQPYFGRWRVVWITLTTPFYNVFSIFCSAVSLTCYLFFLPRFAREGIVLSQYFMRDWQQVCHQSEFEEPLLVPSYNHHQFFTYDVYGIGDVAMRAIHSPEIRSLTHQEIAWQNGVKEAIRSFYIELAGHQYTNAFFRWLNQMWYLPSKAELDRKADAFLMHYQKNPTDAIENLRQKYQLDYTASPLHLLDARIKEIATAIRSIPNLSLYHNNGMCFGASMWFIYLFIKTQTKFQSRDVHLFHLAELFRTGMPRQASILQTLGNPDDLLQLEKIPVTSHTISSYEVEKSPSSCTQKIKTLPMGIYRVGTGLHSLVYIKESPTQTYVWNPTFGLYKMGPDALLNMIKKHHFDVNNPACQIYFHRYGARVSFGEVGE